MNVWRAAHFLLALGSRLDRRRLARAVVLMLGGYLAAPFAALALGRFADAALAQRGVTTALLAPTVACLLVAQLMLSHFAHLDYFELAEIQETRLREELIDLVNRTPTIDHLDSPVFADNVALVREGLASSTRALEGVLQLGGLLIQTVITTVILVLLEPWLGLLPLAALPPVVLARKAQSALERARERTAESVRLHRHLVEVSTRAESVKELRLFGAEPAILAHQERAWQAITGQIVRGQAASALVRAGGQLIFAIGYGAAIILVVQGAAQGRATVGDLVVVITLAVQVSVQIGGALSVLGLLQSAGTMVERLNALRAMAQQPAPSAPMAESPARLRQGVTLENVSFAYPGSDRPVLRNVSLQVPAGHTLALVGENGAGKSTLVKLLCGLYRPTEGRILVDGVDLSTMDPVAWRSRIAALFQDFLRLEFTLRECVGLGEVSRLADDAALREAVTAARAEGVVAAVPDGLDGYLGRSYGDGIELSGGQWQTVGLVRSLMRTRPRLLILDEPAAALDATAEHAMFERYTSAASSAARAVGSVTVLISHRFSTVLMADTIAVLQRGHLIETGTHDELMLRGGLYSELFALQARAYR